MSTSIPPKSSGGGNTKYAVIGILLLLGASTALYFAMKKPPPPPETVERPLVRDAGVEPPIGPTVGQTIELPPEEPDSGPTEDAGPNRGPHIRYVTHYVAACPGRVDGARVSAVVRQNYGGLRECYNRQLRSNPTLRGNVTAEWIINSNGTVGQISTNGSVARDRGFKTCFESSLSRLRFPPAQGGCAMFQQSFTFTPGGA